MTQEVSKTQQYDASNIQVLEGLEAVRKTALGCISVQQVDVDYII